MDNEILPGKKTYIVGAAMIAYAALGVFLADKVNYSLDPTQATEIALQGLGLIALRLGIKKA